MTLHWIIINVLCCENNACCCLTITPSSGIFKQVVGKWEADLSAAAELKRAGWWAQHFYSYLCRIVERDLYLGSGHMWDQLFERQFWQARALLLFRKRSVQPIALDVPVQPSLRVMCGVSWRQGHDLLRISLIDFRSLLLKSNIGYIISH